MPACQRLSSVRGYPLWLALSATVPAISAALLVLGLRMRNHTPPLSKSASPDRPAFPLEISPRAISLGILSMREGRQTTLSLRNPQSESISVDRIETGCPCIEVGPVPVLLDPGDIREMVVSFDPSSEPDFQGAVSVDIAGCGSGGRVLFRARVDFEVRPNVDECLSAQQQDTHGQEARR